MAPLTLRALRHRITELAAQIGVPPNLLPTFGRSDGDGTPHLEVDDAGMHVVVIERSTELSRVTSRDPDEILRHVFSGITFSLAGNYELQHRDEKRDPRRLLFARQVELLGILSPEWARLESVRHQEILRRHPFDDNAAARVARSIELRRSGLSDDEAWRLACERYPVPAAGE